MARDTEDSNFSGRVKRYAQVSAAVGGLAARLAGQRYLGLNLDRGQHAAELKAALGGLKGPLMKVAQIMSTIPDALPREYVEELAQLQANAPSMGWPFVKRRMAAELGPDWQKRYRNFGHEAAAAASLGQVHKAVAHDGRTLACKLQYPDMQSAVEADLKQLKLVFAVYERYDRAIDTANVHQEVSARLREELDYDLEARHMRLYRHMHRDEPGVHVAEVIPELSTRRLLTMAWLDGTPLLRFIDEHEDQELRNEVARHMFHAWYAPFYGYGTIHGDPHLGNYTVRPDRTINLLDFGCIRVFHASFVQGVIDLYHALRDDDPELAVHAYETWGFQGLTKEVIDVLNLWAKFVYAPLMEDRPRRIQETDSGIYGREVAETVHRELNRLGGVRPPREFVFMDRAAIGLGSVFLRLRARLNWHRLYMGLIEDFHIDALHRRQTEALTKVGVPLPQ